MDQSLIKSRSTKPSLQRQYNLRYDISEIQNCVSDHEKKTYKETCLFFFFNVCFK